MEFITGYEMISMAVFVALIVAISEGAKKLGINPKFLPVLDLVLGVGMCVAFTDMELRFRVFNGLIVGLSASGLFSGAKNVLEGVGAKKELG